MHDQAQRHTWPRLLALMAAYDLVAITGPGFAVWFYWFGLDGMPGFASVALARVLASYVQLHVLFTPLRRWHAGERELSDDALLQLDTQLQRAPRRFAARYVAILVVALVVIAAMVHARVGASVDAGTTELFMLVLVVLAAVLGVSSMLTSLGDPQLVGVRARIGAELAERGLASRRVSTSIAYTSARLNVRFTLALFYFTVTLMGVLAVQGWRSAGLAEQRVHTLVARDRLVQTGELAPGFELLGEAELPDRLQDPRTAEDTGVRAVLDVRHDTALAAAPTPDGRWLVGARTIDTQLDTLMVIALGWPLVFLVPLLASNIVSARAQARQLEALHLATRRILDGEPLQAIARMHPPQRDELGQLMLDFNDLLDVFTELALAAKAVAAGDLSVALTNTGDLHDAFRGMLARLQGLVGQLQSTTHELATAATQLQHSVDQHESVILEQSQSVDEISLTLEHLAQAAARVNASAADVLDNADRTRSTADAMVGEIATLTAHAANIGALLSGVREIANRSDLLALNGSLEATRAGEAGRGFALVATEMRRLAERIAETVTDMQARVAAINSASASTEAATTQTRTLAEQTAETARRISQVVESQSEDTRRAVGSMYELGERVDGTTAASSSVRDASTHLTTMAGDLALLLAEFRVPKP